ncbi:hypothetical protein [Draconibacterium halophilum]|uniref:Uncharacterized protein n=1 Tax=Draconibacterium halophilum TaxID=2706887 RepID=A0A6C0R881_9BACT|nr:hypothetical protein [Draconibacterium halophilum]QIA06440.1 hypothetical protein G0Q07_01260 [Draconibacterium halophilum]
MRQFKHVNKALGVERLELVNGTASLHIDQIDSLNRTIEKLDAKGERKITQIESETATVQNETAKFKAKSLRFGEALDSIDPLVKAQSTVEKKIAAVRAILSAKPGVKLDMDLNDKQPGSKEEQLLAKDLKSVDWETIDALEHNKRADDIKRN